jgi:large subunit ribosomal protein L4
MTTPEEPEGLAQESAQDETPEAAEEAAEAETKPKPARRRPAAEDKVPVEDAVSENAVSEDAVSEDTGSEDSEAEDAVEETEAAEAPAKAPARRTTRKQPVAKPKRAPAVASYNLADADLPAEIFDVGVNVPLIHQVVVAQQAAARQGTHATKTRGDVRGGGRKPYRQKGTGRARQGSIRAPQFAGGGIVHGPVPRSYVQKTPKKMKAAALRGALSDRARHGLVQVVDGFADSAEPKTRDAIAVLNLATQGNSASQGGRPPGTPPTGHNVLVVAETSDQATWKSLRNVVGVHLIDPGQLNTYDVLVSDRVVFTTAALASFVARVGSASESPRREDAQL